MDTGHTSRGSPRAHQILWGLTVFTLLLVVEQTNSQEYHSWNYGRNQLFRDLKETVGKINDRLDGMDNSFRDIKREIKYIRNVINIPLTHEELLVNLSCPQNFFQINTSLECIHIADRYSTYKEATENCASLGAYLFVPKDMKLLGDFLMEIGSPSTHPPIRRPLSHDIFWIGADNNIQPDMMRWVDGKPVDLPISVYSTEPDGMTDLNPRTNVCGVLRLDKHGGDDESGGNKLTVKPCEEPQRYPYLCEIESGSESISPEYPTFREICPDGFFQFPTGECVSAHNESLSYSEAANICAPQGATLMHPRNLTVLINMLTDNLAATMEHDSTDPFFQEENGIWLSNTVTSIDPEWNDMMEQSKQQENGESDADMCTLLRIKPSKNKIYKEIASCSSRETFLCGLKMHPKVNGDIGYGPHG